MQSGFGWLSLASLVSAAALMSFAARPSGPAARPSRKSKCSMAFRGRRVVKRECCDVTSEGVKPVADEEWLRLNKGKFEKRERGEKNSKENKGRARDQSAVVEAVCGVTAVKRPEWRLSLGEGVASCEAWRVRSAPEPGVSATRTASQGAGWVSGLGQQRGSSW